MLQVLSNPELVRASLISRLAYVEGAVMGEPCEKLDAALGARWHLVTRGMVARRFCSRETGCDGLYTTPEPAPPGSPSARARATWLTTCGCARRAAPGRRPRARDSCGSTSPCASVVDAARALAPHGARRIVLTGHSLGGALAV